MQLILVSSAGGCSFPDLHGCKSPSVMTQTLDGEKEHPSHEALNWPPDILLSLIPHLKYEFDLIV